MANFWANFCKQMLSSAFSSSYNAKMFVLFLGYVLAFCAMLPSVLEVIHHYDTLPADHALESRWSQYFYLIFLPFIGFTALYIENFIGILVLFFALILSDRLKIFQHYALLYLLYLLCAYLSLEYGSLMPGFYSNILGALDMIAHHNYALLFAFYSRGIVWVFLALAVFDVAFYRIKCIKPPRLVRENLIFALLLYVVVFGIYSYDSKSLVLY